MDKIRLRYKEITKDELAKFLCDLVEETAYRAGDMVPSCEACVAYDDCYKDHLGFLDWLDDENV